MSDKTLTLEGFELGVHAVDTAMEHEDRRRWRIKLKDHDAAQRAEIERLRGLVEAHEETLRALSPTQIAIAGITCRALEEDDE